MIALAGNFYIFAARFTARLAAVLLALRNLAAAWNVRALPICWSITATPPIDIVLNSQFSDRRPARRADDLLRRFRPPTLSIAQVDDEDICLFRSGLQMQLSYAAVLMHGPTTACRVVTHAGTGFLCTPIAIKIPSRRELNGTLRAQTEVATMPKDRALFLAKTRPSRMRNNH